MQGILALSQLPEDVGSVDYRDRTRWLAGNGAEGRYMRDRDAPQGDDTVRNPRYRCQPLSKASLANSLFLSDTTSGVHWATDATLHTLSVGRVS